MIQTGSYLRVTDNSGAKEVLCIKVLGGFRKRYAAVGDVILVSVKSLRPKRKAQSKVQKGSIQRALVTRLKKNLMSSAGNQTKFFLNDVVLLNRQNKPIGSRVFGGMHKSFRFGKYMRVVSMSSGLVK